jgi:hypothetical protein
MFSSLPDLANLSPTQTTHIDTNCLTLTTTIMADEPRPSKRTK